MRKNWHILIILAIIASLFVVGCGGGGEEGTDAGAGGSIEKDAKEIDGKVLAMKGELDKLAEDYSSNPSTQTLTAIIDFTKKQDEELTKLGVQAANLAAEVKEEAEAEPATAAVELISEAKALMEELSKAAEASLKILEEKHPEAEKYLESVKGVKEALKAAEEFFAEKGGEGGGGH